MKRRRSETSREATTGQQRQQQDQEEPCVKGRRNVKDSDVVAAPRPRPGHAPSTPATPFLSELRAHAHAAVFQGGGSVRDLQGLVEALLVGGQGQLGEEVEGVATLLFLALTHPALLPPSCARVILDLFLDRWEGAKGVAGLQCTASSLLLLLSAAIFPECSWGQVKEGGPHWLPGSPSPPAWLVQVAPDGPASLVRLLQLVVTLQAGQAPLCPGEGAGTMEAVVWGGHLYQQGQYQACVKALQALNPGHCGPPVQGCRDWLLGLAYHKLGQPHLAVVRLGWAVDRSPMGQPALFSLAQVLHHTKDQLAVLNLLSRGAREEEEETAWGCEVEGAVLRLLLRPPPHTRLRALYLLAATQLQAKMAKEACHTFTKLLEELEALQVPVVAPQPSLLLREGDQGPLLPSLATVQLLSALAHLQQQQYSAVLSLLPPSQPSSPSQHQQQQPGVSGVVWGVARVVVRARALLGTGAVSQALQECARLEVTLAGWDGGGCDSGGAGQMVLQARVVLYATLAHLHQARHSSRSQAYYTRLVAQTLQLVKGDSESWQECWQLPPDQCEVAQQVVCGYMKEQLLEGRHWLHSG